LRQAGRGKGKRKEEKAKTAPGGFSPLRHINDLYFIQGLS
jgi:hypothetical protein